MDTLGSEPKIDEEMKEDSNKESDAIEHIDEETIKEVPSKEKKKKKNESRGWKYEIFDLVRTFLICFVVVMLISNFVVKPVHVDGDSMHPTLNDGEIGLINIFSVQQQGIERQDVVVAKHEDYNGKEDWVKRVIGLPNDTVYAKNDVIYINDKALAEPYLDNEYANNIRKQGRVFTEDFDKVTLQDDEYFLMGDNRVVSFDSRKVGAFKEKDIIGKDAYIIFPFGDMKMVRNGASN